MLEYAIVGGFLLWGFLARFSEAEANDKETKKKPFYSPYNQELVQDFENLAKILRPSERYLYEVNVAACTIFDHLIKVGSTFGLKIARTKVAGSVGKSTGISYGGRNGKIINPDLDLIVFLDGVEAPFQEELKLFAELLVGLDEVSDIKVKKFSIQFRIWTPSHGDVKVDLLAAANHLKYSYAWRDEDLGEVAAMGAMKELDVKQREALSQTRSVSQEENKLYSSAFAEQNVKVISDFVEDDFVHDVVCLAKFWNGTIDMKEFGYVPARSCIIELLAIFAQQTKRISSEERCIISGFRRFLELAGKFHTLDVTLQGDVDASVLEQRPTKPMVRDPVNSWNNLAEGIPPGAIKLWEQEAKKSLAWLQELRNNREYVENAIENIFYHKPASH